MQARKKWWELEAIINDGLGYSPTLPPADCTGDCYYGPCNCSGKYRWPEKVSEAFEALVEMADRLKEAERKLDEK